MAENRKIGLLRFNRQSIKFYISFVLLITLAMWVCGYIMLWNSHAYSFAKNYVGSNQIIARELGSITSDHPGFVNFKQSYSSGVWISKFHVVLNGDKKNGTVYFSLKSSELVWDIQKAVLNSEDGSTIILSN